MYSGSCAKYNSDTQAHPYDWNLWRTSTRTGPKPGRSAPSAAAMIPTLEPRGPGPAGGGAGGGGDEGRSSRRRRGWHRRGLEEILLQTSGDVGSLPSAVPSHGCCTATQLLNDARAARASSICEYVGPCQQEAAFFSPSARPALSIRVRGGRAFAALTFVAFTDGAAFAAGAAGTDGTSSGACLSSWKG